jgi:hypothetical protein
MNTLDNPQELETAKPASGLLRSIGLRLAVVVALIVGLALASVNSASATSTPPGPVTVTPIPGPLETLTGNAPNTTLGSAYSYVYTATALIDGCVVAAGTLPAGLTLSGCKISGKPTKAGTYTFTVSTADHAAKVSDSILVSTTTITGQAPDMVSTPGGWIQYQFSYTTNSPGGCIATPTYGSFPPGLAFHAATCTFYGAPSTPGTYRFNIYTADWTTYIADTIVVTQDNANI